MQKCLSGPAGLLDVFTVSMWIIPLIYVQSIQNLRGIESLLAISFILFGSFKGVALVCCIRAYATQRMRKHEHNLGYLLFSDPSRKLQFNALATQFDLSWSSCGVPITWSTVL